MSKLINLIRALLSRFTTPAQAANSAMPSDSLMTFEYAGTNTSITSPNDGYITVYAESTQTDRDLKIYPDPGASGVGSGIWLPSSTGGFAFVPVRKGQKVIVWGTNLTSASIRFFKCIGGGYKRFIFNALQRFGGGLCLSYLATFERSLSSLARKQCLQVSLFRSQLQTLMAGRMSMLLRVMVTFVLSGKAVARMPVRLFMVSESERQAFQISDMCVSLFQLKKALVSITNCVQARLQMLLSALYQLSVARLSFCQGGAL